ncbi:unnamed protein product [Medioppia subpectinata]|uniref:G-protein coupled receptors family 1 profile domain-containing protein n=1 Tax=Medioppia subpectinata TaxID=1979941 RepID=A0A7R9KG84_9ACAR|nr:unnamed protein product [Medioppia subpectinata]CAG2102970.1 unnamed protein product [Medioppia subpectinata]
MKFTLILTLSCLTAYGHCKTISVSNADQLTKALSSAAPGDTIQLADGAYKGKFTGTISGKSGSPITVTGSKKAVLSGDSYGFWLKADWWVLKGFKVDGAKKGIMLEGANHNVLDNVEVCNVVQEAVHFRASSADNTLQNSFIHDTGKGSDTDKGFGEGVYIGNAVLNNRIGPNVAAEGVDMKEGSCCGTIKGNTFDGTGMSGKNDADSWTDCKGEGYTITDNTGKNSLKDGFQIHFIKDSNMGGTKNTIKNNKCSGLGSGGKCAVDASGVLSMPVFAYHEVVHLSEWRMGYAMCHIHIFFTHVLTTVSFLHIFFIAIDRYLSVSRVEYSRNPSLRPARVMIAISWTLPLAMGVGLTINHIGADLLYVETIITTPKLQTRFNCLILSLSIADLMVGVVSMPVNAYQELVHINKWPFGKTTCDIHGFITYSMSIASFLHIFFIAIDRYLSVSRDKYLRNPSLRPALIMIVMSWALSSTHGVHVLYTRLNKDLLFAETIGARICLWTADPDDMNSGEVSAKELYFVQLLSSILLFAIIFTTICGNLLIIISVITTPKLHTRSNYLILSLSITDLVVGVFSMPLTAYHEVVHLSEWHMGLAVCNVQQFITYVCSTTSFFHIFFIAIDRYLSVSWVEYSRNRGLRPALIMIGISWTLSLAQGVKGIYTHRNSGLMFVKSMGAYMCQWDDDHDDLMPAFTVVFLILFIINCVIPKELYFIQLLSSILLFVIIFVTIIGNILVITAITTTPKLQIRSNYLILSLSITDLMTGVLSMPVFAYHEVIHMNQWRMGYTMCHIHLFFGHVLSIASFLHICFIAIDRYLSVSRVDYSRNPSKRAARVMIAISWTSAVTMVLGLTYSHINTDLLYVDIIGGHISITTTPKLRTRFNCLILSLSVTDLMVGVMSMPVNAYQEVVHMNKWLFGNTTCNVHQVITYVLSYASGFHIFFIAIDRYLSVSRVDYSANPSLRPALVMIGISWTFSVAQGVHILKRVIFSAKLQSQQLVIQVVLSTKTIGRSNESFKIANEP